jgi:tRNA(fMet)-specific endonuclease VapC
MDALPSRVFMNGNSQAVRIPAEFRLATDRVQISRTPEGDLLIHPCPHQRGQALLDLLAGFDPDFVAALEQQQQDQLLVQERESLRSTCSIQTSSSFITWAELLQGAQGSQRREATLVQLDALSRQVPVLYPEGQAICRHYAQQATVLKRLGTPIGANDLWIACPSLALGATLVSHNIREFARIEGLTLIDWAAA